LLQFKSQHLHPKISSDLEPYFSAAVILSLNSEQLLQVKSTESKEIECFLYQTAVNLTLMPVPVLGCDWL